MYTYMAMLGHTPEVTWRVKMCSEGVLIYNSMKHMERIRVDMEVKVVTTVDAGREELRWHVTDFGKVRGIVNDVTIWRKLP